MRKQIKGYVPKKVEPPQETFSSGLDSVLELITDLRQVKQNVQESMDSKFLEIENILDEKTTRVETAIEESSQISEDNLKKIDEKIVELENTAAAAIKAVQEVATQGNPGKDADETLIVKNILGSIPKLDEASLEERILNKVPKLDENKLFKKFISKIPESKASLKIIQESFTTDPMSVIDQILKLPEEKFKLKTTHIDGLEQTISSFRNQIATKGYLHGGGDTVVAGTNITITSNPNGTKTISASGGGTGSVTSVSVVSANGFAGSVATATSTPAITLTTTITGVLKGNGTAISAAVANTDYQSPITLTTTGTSGVATFNGTTLNIPNYADTDTGITQLTGDVTAGPGSGSQAATLATVNSNVGSFTYASITVNAKGLVTAASSGATPLTTLTVGTTTITSGTTTRILYDNAGVLGEYTITGTGTVVAMATSPSFTTPVLGAATYTTLSGGNITDSGLTAGRVTFAGTAGLLVDDADFTFSVDTLTVTKLAAHTQTGDITMADATNIIVNATTGTKIGTATTQKLGFFNATPIVQPTGSVITALQNLGLGASLTIAASTITSGAALSKTDDTNVTLTLGGSPTTSLLAATSLTLGWTGTLGVTRGGTGASTFTQGSVVFAGSSGVYTEDNANFFWDDTNNRLGIGTAAPSTLLTISANTSAPTTVQAGTLFEIVGVDSTNPSMTIDSFASNGVYRLRRADGTNASKSAVASGVSLGQLNWAAYGSTGYQTNANARVAAVTTQAQTDANGGARLEFSTQANNSVAGVSLRMVIDQGGNVGIGGVTAPTQLLSLQGQSARTIILERHTTSNTAGNALTIKGGGATSGATDKNGGGVVFNSGESTGTGTSNFIFNAYAAGSTGTSDNSPTTALTLGVTSAVFSGIIRTASYTVATLPAGTQGDIAYVTDQLTAAAAKGVAPTGGGAVKCVVFYTGAGWVGI